MSEWKEYKLGEIYDFASGLSKSRDQFGFGYSFLSFKDVFHNYFIPKEITELANSTEKERKQCSIKRGDVFLTRTSETQEELGMSSVALKDYPDATFNGFTKRLRPKNNIDILPEYAGFYFRSPRFRATVTSMASITTRASLNNGMLSDLTIVIPPLPEQRAIASVLSSLHDKRDLLHRQNKTLEALAETLFRQWFVEEAEEGWGTGKLGDYASVTTGKGLKRDEFIDNGIYPVLGANGEIGRTNNYLTEDRLILTGRVGTLGKVIISKDKVWISDNVLIIKPHAAIYFYPIYFNLKRTEFENLNVGSTQPLVTQTDLKNIDFSLPSGDILKSFENHCSVYYEKKSRNDTQIRTLTRLRDTLLPKLMSGEVRVENENN